MKKISLFLVLFVTLAFAGQAQTGHNQISIGPEVDIPVGSFGDIYKTGFGGTIKGLWGVGTAGQVTLMSGYSTFKGKNQGSGGFDYSGMKFGIIPILVGYRQNFNGLYVEPQLGEAIYTTKSGGFKEHETRFTYGGGIGFSMNALDLGARIQSHEGATLVAIRLAYAFGFGKK